MGGTDVGESIAAWYHAVLNDAARPRFTWRVEDDGTIRVQTTDAPGEVRLWQASNPETRDFRKQTIGDAWTSTPYRRVIITPGFTGTLLFSPFPKASLPNGLASSNP